MDAIVIGIILIILVIALLSVKDKIKSKSGCCGGSNEYQFKKRKIGKVVGKKIISIEGMHCNHCRNRVMEIINSMEGICGEVNLKRNEAVIEYDHDFDIQIMIDLIEKAGYQVK